MARQADGVMFTPVSTGTVDFVVSAAVQGYMTPATAGMVNGALYKYRAESLDLSQWEIGEGAYTVGSTTLARTTVLFSSTGSKVSFTAAPNVGITLLKEDHLATDEPNAFTQLQKAQARANIDALKRNYAINSAMMISQENGATSGALSGSNYYPVDEFPVAKNLATGTANTAQVASTTPGGSLNRLRVTVTAAQVTIAAGERAQIRHVIEGLRAADLLLGAASAKTITIQFGVKAPAGTYCIALGNNAGNRSYIAEYTITGPQANTDVVKSVTIPLDQTGTWTPDVTGCLWVYWTLASGTTFQTAAGAWTAGFFTGDSNQFNLFGTNGNVFELFDVGIYEGAAAPVYQVPDYIYELALCKRYYFTLGGGSGSATLLFQAVAAAASAVYSWTIFYGFNMRVAPTITPVSPTATNCAAGFFSDVGCCAIQLTSVAAGGMSYFFTNVAPGRLTFNSRI